MKVLFLWLWGIFFLWVGGQIVFAGLSMIFDALTGTNIMFDWYFST